eukprot:1389927-Pyramimonas_sp.AAC.1
MDGNACFMGRVMARMGPKRSSRLEDLVADPPLGIGILAHVLLFWGFRHGRNGYPRSSRRKGRNVRLLIPVGPSDSLGVHTAERCRDPIVREYVPNRMPLVEDVAPMRHVPRTKVALAALKSAQTELLSPAHSLQGEAPDFVSSVTCGQAAPFVHHRCVASSATSRPWGVLTCSRSPSPRL